MRSIRNRRRLNEEIGITADDVKAAFEKAGIKVHRVYDASHQFGDGYFRVDITKPANIRNGFLVLKDLYDEVRFSFDCVLGPIGSFDENEESDMAEFLKRFKKTRAILEDMVEALGDVEFKRKDI